MEKSGPTRKMEAWNYAEYKNIIKNNTTKKSIVKLKLLILWFRAFVIYDIKRYMESS